MLLIVKFFLKTKKKPYSQKHNSLLDAIFAFVFSADEGTVADIAEQAKHYTQHALLKTKLKNRGLFESLATLEERCLRFVLGNNSNFTMEGLIATLCCERDTRKMQLPTLFTENGMPDPRIQYADDKDFFDPYDELVRSDDDYGYGGYGYDMPYWFDEKLSTQRVNTLCMIWIEFGKGSCARVVACLGKSRRAKALEAALNGATDMLPGDLERVLHSHPACQKYITNGGEQTTQDFLKELSIQLGGSLKSLLNEAAWDSDDDHDGSDWKYHMSGDDYGNDPDRDSMWDSYWDS
jgi:hypothetical protein